MSRVYLDSAPVIYLVEGTDEWADLTRSRLIDLDAQFITSQLTRMECRVGALRARDPRLLRLYEQFFQQSVREMLSITEDVFDLAAEIRAEHRFHTPDAIHLAAAVVGRCEVFLTNDIRLARYTGLRVETVSP